MTPLVTTDAVEALLSRLRAEPQRHARYDVHELIGRGGMGAVFRATDRDMHRRVAMKVLEDGRNIDAVEAEERRQRFLAEAQVTGQLDHPGIVSVHDLGLDSGGKLFFTMKLVRGRTLTEILPLAASGQEGWTLTRVLGVILKVCEALAFAHARGVIHRDLKADNVMVGRFGETYVMDWGLSRLLHEPVPAPRAPDVTASSRVHTVRETDGQDLTSPLVTADGAVVGTPSFMAPEQAEGRIADLSPRTDVYAVGAVLYQLLTGEIPYARQGGVRTPRTILASVLAGPPTPILEVNPTAPADLVAVCEKAMSRRQEQRYTTALELARDIEAFLERRPVRARRGLWHSLWLRVVRHKAIAATAAAAIVTIAAVAAWSLHRVAESRRSAQRVADLLMAQALSVEAQDVLTPRAADTADRTVRWLDRTEALLARGPDYAEGISAAPLSGEELTRLREHLADLAIRRDAAVKGLQLAASACESPSGPCMERWREVFAYLAADERWRTLDALPQPGLVPLRRNPAGYWQFLLADTGDEPAVDESTGELRMEPGSGIVLVLLPGGALELGYEGGEPNEQPYRIDLGPFLMASHETTQAQWLRAMGINVSQRLSGTVVQGMSYSDCNPVESVSWYDAAHFAAVVWARLPCEAELEYAGRAGSPAQRWFDGRQPDEMEGIENLADQSSPFPDLPWDDGFRDHAPVGSFRANALGLFDVAGNVSEWASDRYTEKNGTEPARVADQPDWLQLRVLRGSTWGEPVKNLRASYRKYQRPRYATHWVGVRLARSWMQRGGVEAAANIVATTRRRFI